MSTTTGGFIAGALAACGAVTVTHSFETVKIRSQKTGEQEEEKGQSSDGNGFRRLQLQGELQNKNAANAHKQYRGVFHGIKVILQHEGPRGLFRGLTTAYCYQILLNGCRLGLYEPMRSTLSSLLYSDAAHQSMGINVFSGAASGVLGAACGSPFFLVKTRLQSFSPFNPVGTQHHYRGAIDGFGQIMRNENGISGLYRGVGAAMVRTGFGSSVQLPTYFLAKRQLLRIDGVEDGPGLHLGCSAAAGFVVCCVMHPPDTIMSRLYNQTGNLYTGVWDCLCKTVRAEGVLAIYKGYVAHLARILPHTTLTLTLMEQTTRLMRGVEDRYLPEWLREMI
ncbi:Mitochondrial oxaloacetate carrier protein [Ascosphaera atra]|nr:Mitochondrial oxaloacetate carrier protein [Ascosphaera atra]